MAFRANPRYAAAYEILCDIYAKMAAQSCEKVVGLNRDNKSAATKLNPIRKLLSKSGNRQVVDRNDPYGSRPPQNEFWN